MSMKALLMAGKPTQNVRVLAWLGSGAFDKSLDTSDISPFPANAFLALCTRDEYHLIFLDARDNLLDPTVYTSPALPSQ